MKITWDPPKHAANLKGHKLDFAMVTLGFFEAAAIFPAKHGRSMAIGEIDGRVYVVVFARLGREAISLISFRRADRKERGLYETYKGGA